MKELNGFIWFLFHQLDHSLYVCVSGIMNHYFVNYRKISIIFQSQFCDTTTIIFSDSFHAPEGAKGGPERSSGIVAYRIGKGGGKKVK